MRTRFTTESSYSTPMKDSPSSSTGAKYSPSERSSSAKSSILVSPSSSTSVKTTPKAFVSAGSSGAPTIAKVTSTMLLPIGEKRRSALKVTSSAG